MNKRLLHQIEDILDEFYPAVLMRQKYRNASFESVPLGFLMIVILRAKIYDGVRQLINLYKNNFRSFAGTHTIVNRIQSQLKLHRHQIKKFSKDHPTAHEESVKAYWIGLAALLHVAFGRQLQSRDI